MKTSEAKKLINTELTKLMGFDMETNNDFKNLALGVKLGRISPEDAAKKIIEAIKF